MLRCVKFTALCDPRLAVATEGAAVHTVGDHHMSIFTPTQKVMDAVKTKVESLMNDEQVCVWEGGCGCGCERV